MNDFLGGMNPGFPSSFLNVIEDSAPTNKLTNAAIRESKTVLSDKAALKQQANSDRFNNQTEGAVPVAQNDIEPPKADDYQRLAMRSGSGPVINARRAETNSLFPFVPIEPSPALSYQVHVSGNTNDAVYVEIPVGVRFYSVQANTASASMSVNGTPRYNNAANTVLENSGIIIPTAFPRFFYCEGAKQLGFTSANAGIVNVIFYF